VARPPPKVACHQLRFSSSRSIHEHPSESKVESSEAAMADKEATVYIIDVGESMGRKGNGRTETDLEWAMQYVWDKITTTVRISSAPHVTL